MKLYNDSILNEKANKINTHLEQLSEAMAYMGSSITGEQIELSNPAATEVLLQKITTNGLNVGKESINQVLQEINYLKSVVGSQDDVYLELSEGFALIVSAIINIPVGFANGLSMASDFHKDQALVKRTSEDLAEATRLMSIISSMDMSAQARNVINRNINMINNVEKRVNTKTGCYIASCVYGSYNANEVLQLRSYRDNILTKNIFGRIFIDVYYLISPKIVLTLGRFYTFRKLSKLFLDRLINSLNK